MKFQLWPRWSNSTFSPAVQSNVLSVNVVGAFKIYTEAQHEVLANLLLSRYGEFTVVGERIVNIILKGRDEHWYSWHWLCITHCSDCHCHHHDPISSLKVILGWLQYMSSLTSPRGTTGEDELIYQAECSGRKKGKIDCISEKVSEPWFSASSVDMAGQLS